MRSTSFLVMRVPSLLQYWDRRFERHISCVENADRRDKVVQTVHIWVAFELERVFATGAAFGN